MLKKLKDKKHTAKEFVYKKIDDYFVDKEQLKRYKNKKLMPMEKIVLTNNNTFSDLKINIDDFDDAVIVFENSAFSSLNIINSCCNYSTLKFVGCDIAEGEILLNSKSKIEIDSSYIKKIKVNGNDIALSHIVTKNELDVCTICLGNSYTNTIKINEVSQKVLSPVIISVEGKSIDIDNSDIVLNSNCYDVEVDNSKIVLWKIQQIKNLILKDSFVSTYISTPKKISCSTVRSIGDSTIVDLHLDTKVLYVEKSSVLTPINLSIDASNLLMLGDGAKINKSNLGTSLVSANNIYLNPQSCINTDNMQYENPNNSCKKISIEQLKSEREKLVKTLKLVENKCNRQIMNLYK